MRQLTAMLGDRYPILLKYCLRWIRCARLWTCELFLLQSSGVSLATLLHTMRQTCDVTPQAFDSRFLKVANFFHLDICSCTESSLSLQSFATKSAVKQDRPTLR